MWSARPGIWTQNPIFPFFNFSINKRLPHEANVKCFDHVPATYDQTSSLFRRTKLILEHQTSLHDLITKPRFDLGGHYDATILDVESLHITLSSLAKNLRDIKPYAVRPKEQYQTLASNLGNLPLSLYFSIWIRNWTMSKPHRDMGHLSMLPATVRWRKMPWFSGADDTCVRVKLLNLRGDTCRGRDLGACHVSATLVVRVWRFSIILIR